MRAKDLLQTIDRHKKRLKVLEGENHRLREENAQRKQENVQLKEENAQLKETLKQYADATAAKKPKIGLNYSSKRNEPKDAS